jgi:hypothetical protein
MKSKTSTTAEAIPVIAAMVCKSTIGLFGWRLANEVNLPPLYLSLLSVEMQQRDKSVMFATELKNVMFINITSDIIRE